MSNELKSLKNLLYRVSKEITREAKNVAPYKTGNLERDIEVFDDNIGNLEISIGNTELAEYAPYVHQGTGTQARGKSKAPSKKGQKAQPYFEEGISNYLKSGNLDRALGVLGKDISDTFANDLKKTLKNIKVS